MTLSVVRKKSGGRRAGGQGQLGNSSFPGGVVMAMGDGMG
jgi:hypothetical protein